MSQLGTFLLLHVFTALLPPKDVDDLPENEYYHVLGLTASKRQTSADDIKKAYRTLSLELHPDKIAQRRGGTDNVNGVDPTLAAARYEKVQQAYAVLSDPKERHKYHVVACSPARYQFVYQQGWRHPTSLLENISGASCGDKFRLVLLVVLLVGLVLLQPILLAVKVNADQNSGRHDGLLESTDWSLVLIPFWILYGLYILVKLLLFGWTKQRDLLLQVLQHVCFLVGCVLLVREWDQTTNRPRASVNWFSLATPFYLAVLFCAAGLSERVRSVTQLQDKLVSPDYMQQQQATHEHGDNNLTEEQRQELRDSFVVVTPNDVQVATALAVMQASGQDALTAEELEALKVQTSPEYQHLQQQSQRLSWHVLQVLVYPTIFISLVAAKLDERIHDASWWLVFLPIWIHLGLQLVQSCCTCLCLGAALTAGDEEDEEDENEEEENEAADEAAVDATDAETATPETFHQEGEKMEAATETNKSKGETMENGKEIKEETNEKDPNGKEEEERDGKEANASLEREVEEKQDEMSALKEDVLGEDPKMDPTMDPVFQSTHDIESKNQESESETIRLFDPPTSNTFFEKAKEKEGQEDQDDDKKEEEDSGDIPELDEEEAFRQWQKAQSQEMDNAAIEAQARAQWICCTSVFELVTICLVVAKLQDSFDGDQGYNAFWILFPTFLIAGLALCCCICLVYSTPDMAKMEEYMRQQEGGGGDGEGEAHPGDEEEAMPMPPATSDPNDDVPDNDNDDDPSGQEETPGATTNGTSDKPATDVETGKTEEPTEDINDLD